jgi:hypothetical protein
MANNFLTTDLISNYTLAEFVNNNPFLQTASRNVQADFQMADYRIGDTVNIRRVNRFLVGDGQVGQVQDVLEQSEQLTINHQYNVLIQYSSKDLTLAIDDFNERYIQPAVLHMINKMEFDIAIQAARNLNFFEGTAGTPINSFGALDAANSKLMEMGVPMLGTDSYCALSVRDGGALKNSLANFFNPILNENITQNSVLGRLSVFDMFQSQNIFRQISGTPGAGPITTTAIVTSGNSIPMTGFTPATLVAKVGDIFHVAGVQDINPLSYQPSGNQMQFVVTADAISTGGGAATIFVNPTIISDPGNPNRNVSNAIPSGSVVTFIGSHTVNAAYISRGLDIVCPPLQQLDVPFSKVLTDKKMNVSVRLSKQGDIINDINILRLDVLCGFLWHPQYAIRLIS